MMNSSPLIQSTIAFCAAGFLTVSARAAIVTHSDLASFLLAAGPVAFESFEQSAPLSYGTHPATSVGPFTMAADRSFGIVTTGPTIGQHATDGTHYLATNARMFRFTFPQPIMALSMDIVDFGDLPVDLGQELTMTTSAGDPILVRKTVGDFDPSNGNVFFFGFTSSVPLTELIFTETADDNMNVDAVRVATVPEPSGALMRLGGAGCLLALRRGTGLRR